MKKRMILMILGMVLFVSAMGVAKFLQIRAAIAQGASFRPPPEAVTTAIARQEEWPATLNAIGTVVAVHGVTVSADLPGIVERIAIESGRPVAAGEVLVRLDTSQEEAQLASAEAQLNLAKLNFQRTRDLKDRGVVSQSEYDRLNAEAKQAEARVGEIRATIQRKTIRAPFSGILGLRQINLGQYLNGGDPVVPLQSLDPVYVNFSVPQQEAGKLSVGMDLHLTADGMEGAQLSGRVTAVNSVVDEATRTIEVQGTFDNPGGILKPGMYVQVKVVLGAGNAIVTLPATAISYAPYGNSVYIVTELKSPEGRPYRGVRQQFVKVGGSRGDLVAIETGVNPGDEVVTSGVFKLRNGAAVEVNNQVQPSAEAAPRPEDS